MKTFVFMITVLALSQSAQAASVNGVAHIKVQAQLSAQAKRQLEFGVVTQGDAAGTVAATAAGSAAFDVTGEPNKSYVITLPSAPIMMKTAGGGSPDKEISVSAFTMNKSSNVATLDGSGTDNFTVGGTHGAILATQQSGDYTGDFTVTLLYQ